MSGFIEQPRYSCALGAQQSVTAIKRAVPILHSGPGCGDKINRLLGQGEGYAGGNTVPCTNASEAEIVFGGEEKLGSVIEGAFKVIDADLYVVLTGCTSDIIGDDIGQVTSRYQDLDKPIVYAETGGFKSNNYVSHETVVKAIIDQYVDKFKAGTGKIKGLANVFATIPYQDPFWNGNLEEIKRILEGIGLKVNILFGSESRGVQEWKTIPQAEFNIVVSAWPGLGIAKHLENKYGTSYIHFPYLPIGGVETTKFLRQVADFAALDKDKTEAFIKKEEEKFYMHIERMADFMLEFRYGLPRRFYTILDASYAVGLSKYLLNELGILPARQFIVDDTPEEFQAAIQEQFKNISELRSATVGFLVDAGAIQEEIRADAHKHRALILGSGWERDLAREIGADLLIVSVPVAYRLILNCGYAGYNGGLRVIEDIYDKVLDTYR
ncbi:MAG TPA: nitrogenase component 1 [Methylomusa anaerophila]|uniref:Light-independent protochlorophyllide reductase subunit B n=1 Tax=Methylomusa anaerophila TaxID=1930071 RepID=A0A348AEX9_9FIRM|nr:nitrogenase component 1 [Methylomusa anaerophila]BBB89627.1 light-independent protochlorophyllide reductase subunit B [Methylomusa anaerophila]HML89597.1 nitrogenase component 1 [Methylomusa anaerophila]